MQKILNRVRDFKFYSIIIDESTNISVTDHLVVFIIFVEKYMSQYVYIGLLNNNDH